MILVINSINNLNEREREILIRLKYGGIKL